MALSRGRSRAGTRSALRIPALYVLFALLWITVSDRVIQLLVRQPNLQTDLQTAKGIAFIALTSVLLYTLIRRDQRQMDRLQQRYRSVFHASHDALVIFNSDGQCVEANRATSELTGYSRDELRSLSVYDLAPQTPREWLTMQLQHVADQTIHAQLFEGTIHTKQGIERSVEVAISSLIMNDAPALLCIARDVSERHRAETTLRQSEERFRTLVEAAPVGVTIARNGINLFVNQAYVRMFGYASRDEIVNTPLIDQVAPPYRSQIVERNRQRAAGLLVATSYELIGQRNDGSQFPFQAEVAQIDLADGPASVAFITDITERKRFERVLQNARDVYSTLIEDAPMLIWRVDHTGRCDFINKQMIQFTGYTLEQAAGEALLRLIHPDDAEKNLALATDAWHAQERFEIEIRLQRYDGVYRWMITRGSPFFDEHGHFAGFVGTCIDNSERKRQEQIKDDFLALASHELKTPLAALLGYVHLLARWSTQHGFGARVDQALTAIIHESAQLDRLINDLLDVSLIQTGRLRVTLRPVELRELVRQTTESIRLAQPDHQFRLSLPPTPITVAADAQRLVQVINNLCVNAAKYSPPHTPIDVRLCCNDQTVEFQVQDYGLGIPQADLPYIFERFFQVQRPARESRPGLGLGLFITHEIVRLHGGRVTVESMEHGGSNFTVRLPRVQAGEEGRDGSSNGSQRAVT